MHIPCGEKAQHTAWNDGFHIYHRVRQLLGCGIYAPFDAYRVSVTHTVQQLIIGCPTFFLYNTRGSKTVIISLAFHAYTLYFSTNILHLFVIVVHLYREMLIYHEILTYIRQSCPNHLATISAILGFHCFRYTGIIAVCSLSIYGIWLLTALSA